MMTQPNKRRREAASKDVRNRPAPVSPAKAGAQGRSEKPSPGHLDPGVRRQDVMAAEKSHDRRRSRRKGDRAPAPRP
jgi:hypothetical protein